MNLDVPTIAFISCLTSLTQFIALFVQYRVNKTYQGIGWWLLGSSLTAIGVIFLLLISVRSLLILAMIANPLIILGQIFIYVGIIRFLDKKENKWALTSIFVLFNLFYYYFMFFENSISARTLVIAAVLTLILFISAYRLFPVRDKLISSSARFTAIVFLAYACFSALRFLYVSMSPNIQSYYDVTTALSISFLFPLLASLLWTFGFIIMLNQRLNADMRVEKEKLQMFFNASPDAEVISRLSDGSIVDVNGGFLTMSGYQRAELIGNTTIEVNIWHNGADRDSFINELQENGSCENKECVFQRKDGSLLTGSISAKVITIQSVPHILSVVHDITQKKQAEEVMRESEELYRSILNASPDDITITDMLGRIQMISPAAKQMFGFEPEYEHYIGSQILDYLVPEDRERARLNIISTIKGAALGLNEYSAIRKDGSILDIEVTRGLIRDGNGQPAKMLYIIRDISERKQAEQKIQQLIQQLEIEKKTAQLNAITDSLTGLANRRYFDEALNIEFHRLKRSGSPLSLIMLDVDHFKKFNDRYGHLAGDECLRQIGMTLKTIVKRGTDIVARYGGEEFVVLLTETDQKGVMIVAERIREAIQALAIPSAAPDVAEVVTVSLGVVTTRSSTHLESTDQVIGLADQAMYLAKKGGRNRISVTTDQMILVKNHK